LIASILAAGCGEKPKVPRSAEAAAPGPVFLLGFDGLDPAVVERYESEGLLPNFARLRREGAVGIVRSTLPFISPPAWASVATGVPPSYHGIWSFWIPTPGNPRGRFVDATCRLADPFWADLSRLGRTVGIVDVPVTCPPDSVNGFMIGGFPYPSGAPVTFPPELESEIVAKGYQRDAFTGPPAPGEEEAWLDAMRAMAEHRRTIGLDLLFERRPDLSMIVFTFPDRVQHHLWRFHDPEHPRFAPDAPPRLRSAIRDTYVWCDEVLGEVLSKLRPDETLLVFSDHGFGPARFGISKAKVIEALPAPIRAKNIRGVNLFGGDFYLDESTKDDRSVLVSTLASLADDRGNRLVRTAHDLVGDPGAGKGGPLGPVVFAEEADGYMFVPGDDSSPLVGPLAPGSFSGYHRREGYFAATGHPIQPGVVRPLDLQDIPAMTMHLLGEKIPRRFIQNIPRQLFPAGYFVERPMTFDGDPRQGFRDPQAAGTVPTSAPAPDEGIKEQLESLGYVR
jgi:hypothetical protein